MALGPHTITRLRAGMVENPYSGEPDASDWSSPSSLDVVGCSVQPTAGYENEEPGRDLVGISYMVWAPPAADIRSSDRVVYAGEVHEVSGSVQLWDFGALAHKTFLLRLVVD